MVREQLSVLETQMHRLEAKRAQEKQEKDHLQAQIEQLEAKVVQLEAPRPPTGTSGIKERSVPDLVADSGASVQRPRAPVAASGKPAHPGNCTPPPPPGGIRRSDDGTAAPDPSAAAPRRS